MKRISLKRLVNEIHRLDPKLSEEDDTFKCAVILLTASLIGPNVAKVSKFCQYPQSLVRRFVTNFRSNGIWGHKYVHTSDWDDKKSGGIAFWLDVMIGLGFVERKTKGDWPE